MREEKSRLSVSRSCLGSGNVMVTAKHTLFLFPSLLTSASTAGIIDMRFKSDAFGGGRTPSMFERLGMFSFPSTGPPDEPLLLLRPKSSDTSGDWISLLGPRSAANVTARSRSSPRPPSPTPPPSAAPRGPTCTPVAGDGDGNPRENLVGAGVDPAFRVRRGLGIRPGVRPAEEGAVLSAGVDPILVSPPLPAVGVGEVNLTFPTVEAYGEVAAPNVAMIDQILA